MNTKKKSKILIVDDERAIQKLVARALNSEEYETDIASDGKQAFEALSELLFDCYNRYLNA